MINSSGTVTNNNRAFMKNVLFVFISNALVFGFGICSGFVIPKILSIDSYSYYKTFTLYTAYVGIFHFGFIDGVLLKFAGKKERDYRLDHFRMLTRFVLVMEAVISAIGCLVSTLINDPVSKIVLLLISINLFALNLTSYYEYIVQIRMEFKKLSIRSVIKTAIQASFLGFLIVDFYVFKQEIDPFLYISFLIVSNYSLLVWYIVSYKTYLFGKCDRFSFQIVADYFKSGFPLMLSNLVVMLVCAIDQIFVNIFFDVSTYAYYAFSYSMISVITMATSSISIVLFPTLKSIGDESNNNEYSNHNSYILIFGSLCLMSYYVFYLIVNSFLTKYGPSLSVLKIILPIVLITSPITVVKHNYYKKENMVLPYFFFSLIVLVVSLIADLIVYFSFYNVFWISFVSIFVCLFWNFVIEIYFCRKNNCAFLKNTLFMLLSLIAYYFSVLFIDSIFISFFVYLVFTLIIIFAFYRDILFGRKRYVCEQF